MCPEGIQQFRKPYKKDTYRKSRITTLLYRIEAEEMSY